MLLGLLAFSLASAFAGAALYVNIAEQPARLRLDDKGALIQWKASYARAAPMQATLAALSGAVGLDAAWQSRDWHWVVGAVLVLVPWPFTLIGIKPTNDKLNATPPEAADPAARSLIEKWGRLHRVRTAFGLAATLAYVWALHG